MDTSKNYFDDFKNVKLKLSDFDFELPADKVAQYPLQKRDECRLMVLHRDTQTIEHRKFSDIIEYLSPGDCLVLNNTKVFPARLVGKKDKTGARIEVFLLRNLDGNIWEVMVKPARKVRLGNKILFNEQLMCDVIDNTISGGRIVEFRFDGEFYDLLDKYGQTPLPPYIKRPAEDIDKEYYQTVYAERPGAVAAPTAGLHFTRELLRQIQEKGVQIATVTLHVGLGTFKPVEVEDIGRHQMDSEYYEINEEAVRTINRCRENGNDVIAVGTTSVRVLETVVDRNGYIRPCRGWTDKFIFPPYKFRAVDHLVTNFHLPRSTLLMLVSAFADYDFIMESYQKAIQEDYRFFSYGDAMYII